MTSVSPGDAAAAPYGYVPAPLPPSGPPPDAAAAAAAAAAQHELLLQQQQQQQQGFTSQSAEWFLGNYRLGKTLGIGSFGKVGRVRVCRGVVGWDIW